MFSTYVYSYNLGYICIVFTSATFTVHISKNYRIGFGSNCLAFTALAN